MKVMKNKFERISRGVFCALLLSLFFCNDVFAREFTAKIKNDTGKTLKISKIVKNYSSFADDLIQKIEPTEKTETFTVDVCGYLCLKEMEKMEFQSDGFYFSTNEKQSDEIGVIWGEIPKTGLTPVFGPLDQENGLFRTEVSKKGTPQDPVYVFTIKKIDSKL